jgi:hypothetical protein
MVVDQPFAHKPLDSSTFTPGITEGVPRRQKFRVLRVRLVLEPAEGSLALDGPRQPPPGCGVADALGEVSHILVPDMGWKWGYRNQVEFVDVDRFSPSMPVSAVQNSIFPVRGSISHRWS